MANSHRPGAPSAASVICWSPETVNRIPVMIPTVATDAESNCRITYEAASHRIPTTSHIHHRPVAFSAASRTPPVMTPSSAVT
jgi:hypothetical protein